MSDAIVRFEGVTKTFRRYGPRPFLLRTMLSRLFGHNTGPDLLCPIDDLSFELVAGETVGVVGVNGTGKSTLLALIAGGCLPTRGTITVRGRVAPMLSLGLGFQPDMTGREAIELDARLLGYSRADVQARMPAIVEFAELAAFLDTPLRYYSSGMFARLGFAVATHTEPELLLVDEVLAVGDHEFQARCLARLERLRAGGTTIVTVSHSLERVRAMCTRVLWLDRGKIMLDGPADRVCDAYLAH